MRREQHYFNPHPDPGSSGGGGGGGGGGVGAGAGYPVAATGKAKVWEEEIQQECGMDELLAMMGYKVRASDMQEVAQKLEQLEQFMGHSQSDGASHLASDTVHYNPSDLSTWLQTMLSELSSPPSLEPVVAAGAPAPPPLHAILEDPFVAPAESSTITSIDFADPSCSNHNNNHSSGSSNNQTLQPDALFFEESPTSDYDLKAIPGRAICGQNPPQLESSSSRDSKRLKTSPSSVANPELLFSPSIVPFAVSGDSSRPVVVVDSQENGVRLVHALLACAEAVQQNNLAVAEALVKQIGFLAVSQAGAMRKVATYFAEALARRIYGVHPQNPLDRSLSDILQLHFYETCPYLKFAHFTANQAILEAFEGKKRVHVIDFGINQGLQWPALIQALALRPGGPPAFRLTGIGPPAPDNSDHLQEVGWRLAQLAETIQVEFEYRGFVANSLADLDASMLGIRPSEVETVAVNAVFELHKLLSRPGALEKVLQVVRATSPEIVTLVEQEADHNGPVFLDRFTESLHYYSTMFDSLEGSVTFQDKVMAEVYLGKQICNVVACEGPDRVERHETLDQWRTRLESAGFAPVHLGSNAFKQASMLLALFAGGDGFRVDENNGCLMLAWHTRPLIATSAWRVSP